MLVFLMLLSIVIYLQVGFQLGLIGWRAWSAQKRSFAAFCLFPVSWKRDVVGSTKEAPWLQGINPAQGAYRAAMLLCWPWLLCWSAVVIGTVVGPDRLIRRLTAKKPGGVRVSAELESQNAVLEEESRRLDQEIWELESDAERAAVRRGAE